MRKMLENSGNTADFEGIIKFRIIGDILRYFANCFPIVSPFWGLGKQVGKQK